MSVQAVKPFWSGIDVPKTLAGTLAAVSAAVLGSFLGVAGTVIGAALASVVSTIGTEIYHRSIDRGAKQLKTAFVVAPAAVGTPSVEAAADPAPSDEANAHTGTAASAGTGSDRRINWKRIAFVSAALFVLGMGTLTVAELFAGRSAADVTSGRDSGSPTILFDKAGKDSDEKPVTPLESPAPSGSADGPATKAPASQAPVSGAPETPESPAAATGQPTATDPAGTTPPAGEQPTTGAPQQTGTQPAGADKDDTGQAGAGQAGVGKGDAGPADSDGE